MTISHSFLPLSQGFLFFLTRNLTAYSHLFLKIQKQNQAKHEDSQAKKARKQKKRFPKGILPFFYFRVWQTA